MAALAACADTSAPDAGGEAGASAGGGDAEMTTSGEISVIEVGFGDWYAGSPLTEAGV